MPLVLSCTGVRSTRQPLIWSISVRIASSTFVHEEQHACGTTTSKSAYLSAGTCAKGLLALALRQIRALRRRQRALRSFSATTSRNSNTGWADDSVDGAGASLPGAIIWERQISATQLGSPRMPLVARALTDLLLPPWASKSQEPQQRLGRQKRPRLKLFRRVASGFGCGSCRIAPAPDRPAPGDDYPTCITVGFAWP